MALKDWKKTRNMTWTHKKARTGSGYDYRGNLHPLKSIMLHKTRQGWIVEQNGYFEMNRISPYFETKTQALKFAKEYMKTH